MVLTWDQRIAEVALARFSAQPTDPGLHRPRQIPLQSLPTTRLGHTAGETGRAPGGAHGSRL